MSMMKTSLTIIPMCPRERFSHYKKLSRLVLCYKKDWPPCCTLFTFIACYPLPIISSQNYLLPISSVLAKNTLLKTTCNFLLLLVGFDTLTYRKDYDRSPILVGHQLARFFCDLSSKSLYQACWAANLSRRGEIHSAGRENGLSVMRNGMYIFKRHQTRN